MKNLSDVMGNAVSQPLKFKAADGVEHPVLLFDVNAAAGYENWLKSHAIQSIRSRKADYGEDYIQVLAECNKAIDAGDYAFGGKIANKSISTQAGTQCLVSLLLKVDTIRAKWLLDQHKDELVDLMNKQLERSLPEKPEDDGKVGAENPTHGAEGQPMPRPTTPN